MHSQAAYQPPRRQTTGLAPNIAALLSYLVPVPPITGVILLLLEKEDGFVRFHAMQAVIFGASCLILTLALQLLGVPPERFFVHSSSRSFC